jgi:hypothetical protein
MQGALSPMFRRLVLGGAFLAASLVALLPDSPAVQATTGNAGIILAQAVDPRAAADAAQSAAEAAQEAAEKAREVAREAREKAREAAAEARDAARDARRAGKEGGPRITIDGENASGGRKILVDVPGTHGEFDSFDQFVEKAPAVAAGVVLMFLIAFLTPVMIIGLVIWYKLRKNRMVSDTMLQLAEKGVMPTAEMMQALGSARPGPALRALSAGAPMVEQARGLRKLAAWSDLRRGVIMGAIGFAVTMYSLVNSASANWFGLVLLFVGVGYALLWYFEDQQITALHAADPPQQVELPKDPVN